MVSWGDCSEEVYARNTVPPLSEAYFPGSPASSSSKPWKSSLMGNDCAYARNSWLTICLSAGKTAGRILTSGVVLADIVVVLTIT
jgi:hypothetical protein